MCVALRALGSDEEAWPAAKSENERTTTTHKGASNTPIKHQKLVRELAVETRWTPTGSVWFHERFPFVALEEAFQKTGPRKKCSSILQPPAKPREQKTIIHERRNRDRPLTLFTDF